MLTTEHGANDVRMQDMCACGAPPYVGRQNADAPAEQVDDGGIDNALAVHVLSIPCRLACDHDEQVEHDGTHVERHVGGVTTMNNNGQLSDINADR